MTYGERFETTAPWASYTYCEICSNFKICALKRTLTDVTSKKQLKVATAASDCVMCFEKSWQITT